MNRKRGFTLVETLITVAIIGILLTLAIPSIAPSMSYSRKSKANDTRRIIVNAVDYWVKDNINPVQRPADFNCVNSQGNTVADYITNFEIFDMTDKKPKDVEINGETHKNIVPQIIGKEPEIRLDFKKGVLCINYGYREKTSYYHCVLGKEYFDERSKQIINYRGYTENNRIVEGENYKEYI